MSEEKIYEVPESIKSSALIDKKEYESLYKQSIKDPEAFWSEQARKYLNWDSDWTKVSNADFMKGNVSWFEGAGINASVNCIDRHLKERSKQTAIIWESDDPNESKKISYKELHEAVCKFANALKKRNVKKGDRVCIYMPMIPEAAYAMLACARIGAIHSVVFGGFSPESLKERILDSDCQTVITADEGIRGSRPIPLKKNVDIALKECPEVHTVFVVKRSGSNINWVPDRDVSYEQIVSEVSDSCEPEFTDSENPLFILYTSGSTGKPKGVLHTTGGYLLQVAMTHKLVFDYREGEIYWCTADVGWITGHSYIVYGPLLNGATTLMFEGIPTYPNHS